MATVVLPSTASSAPCATTSWPSSMALMPSRVAARPSPSRSQRTSCSPPSRPGTARIQEAILALRIEDTFSKDKILELYLNEIFLGLNSYGVAAAALNYFDKALYAMIRPRLPTSRPCPRAPTTTTRSAAPNRPSSVAKSAPKPQNPLLKLIMAQP